MNQLVRRYAAGALAVGAFASGITLTPAGSTSAAAAVRAAGEDVVYEKPVPTVTTGPTERVVNYPATASLTFTVKADNVPLAKQPIQICTAALKQDFVCVDATTTTRGVVTARTTRLTSPVRVKVVVPEDDQVQAFESDTVTVRPMVGLRTARKGTNLTVTLIGFDNQYLVLRRQEKKQWLLVSATRADGPTTILSGLAAGQRYQVTVSDTISVKGAKSGTL